MSLSGRGALVGAVCGAVLRGGLTYFNLGAGSSPLLFLICLPPAGIGALCGAAAGATGSPLKGAIVGGFLAGLMFWLFVMPVAYVASWFGVAGKVEEFTFPYLLQRAIAGAIAGAVGGAVAQSTREKLNEY